MSPEELRAKVKEMGTPSKRIDASDFLRDLDHQRRLAAMLDVAIRKLSGIPGYSECDDIASAGGLEARGDE